MSALARLRSTRRVLAAGVLAQALLWAGAMMLAVRGVAPGAGARALGVGFVAALVVLWRGRRVLSIGAAALWVEERRPELAYALVARVDGVGDAARLEAVVAGVRWGGEVRRALLMALLPPLVVAGAALAASGALQRAALVPAAPGGEAGSAAVVGGAVRGRRLAPLRARIEPPAYAGIAAAEVREPDALAALVGSRIVLFGPGAGDSVRVTVGTSSLGVAAAAGGGWSATLVMPGEPTALRLGAPGEERLLVLEPRADSLPVVVLEAPAADTVFRSAGGALPVAARTSDDFGLAALWVEYIVSSGEGESFTFRSGVLGTARPAGKTGAIRTVLSLDALELKPGDLVHLRAVARDRNTVSGPGVGVSATRTLRVVRAGEYDSVSVEAAAPADAEKSALSQRMLLQLAEALERRKGRLAREAVVREAKSIARDQARLRQQVGELVFMRLGGGDGEHSHDPNHPGHEEEQSGALTPEQLLAAADAATSGALDAATDFHGDETPVVAVNRPLLEAYNAMWSAGGELEVGEPGRALPHMRAALAAMQKAREAERLYLRGRPPAVVVDLARVRLARSRADAEPAPRTPRPAADSARARRIARFERAVLLTRRDAAAATDSLLLLRVELLGEHPAAAAALGEALSRLRAGQDATDALVLARRRLAGAPAARSALPRWGGGR